MTHSNAVAVKQSAVAALIERLENAEGPDRWIDARIDAALRIGAEKMRHAGYEWAWTNFPTWAHHKQASGMCGVQHDNGDLGLVWDSPEFTASVDAAIALAERVLPGAKISLFVNHLTSAKDGSGARASVHRKKGPKCPDTGIRWPSCVGECFHAPTAAIAICIATLKAKDAEARTTLAKIGTQP